MHVLILTAGSAGDVHPFVALGRTLRARGHDVTLIANEMFGDLVRRSDLEFVELGTAEQFQRVIANPDLWHPRKGVEVVLGGEAMAALDQTVNTLRAHRKDGTVLVASTLGFGARIVNEVDGTPLASVHLAPSVFQTMYRMPLYAGLPSLIRAPRWLKRLFWGVADRVTDKLLAPEVNRLRGEAGLAPVSRVMMQWAHSPDLVVGLFPDWFGPAQPDWPPQTRLTGFPLFDESDSRPADSELEAWIAAGDAPIVFTAGSANIVAHRFFRESVAACERMGRRGLLVTTNRDSVPAALPKTIYWSHYVPFSRVLPRAAAFVSHGGIGSVAQGIAAGVPQLVAAMGFDQFDNASRLMDLGGRAMLPERRYNAKRAASALDALIGDETLRDACRALRDRLDDAALDDAAALTESLAQ